MQAICDFVHQRLRFSYPEARPTRTASEALAEGVGVCRDFTHLAVALCRCLNIPARYCNGYLGDIGVPPDPAPMDFNAWFEAFLGDRWFTFDARHNQPRIGRILIARGRDAADIPMITTFGSHALTRFTVVTEEIEGACIRSPLDRRFRKEEIVMMTILMIVLMIILLGGGGGSTPTGGMARWLGGVLGWPYRLDCSLACRRVVRLSRPTLSKANVASPTRALFVSGSSRVSARAVEFGTFSGHWSFETHSQTPRRQSHA